MENIILSLLMMKSMTVYEIKMYIQQNLNSICSDSLGSIQTAMKKLRSKKCVTVREYTENNLLKKEYSLTAKGVEQFQEWIQTPMNLHKMKHMEEGKFFFLGIAPKEIRIQSVQIYLEGLKAEREKLLLIQQQVEQEKKHVIEKNLIRIMKEGHLAAYLLDISKEQSLEQTIQNIYDYQIYNLEYGLKRLKDDICFYSEILKRELDKQ